MTSEKNKTKQKLDSAWYQSGSLALFILRSTCGSVQLASQSSTKSIAAAGLSSRLQC